MSEIDKLYSLGLHGIDTKYERDLINYEPVLEYVKRRSLEKGYSINKLFVPSPYLTQLIDNNIPKALESLNKAKSLVTRSIDTLKEKLKDVSVKIEDPNPEKVRIIKEYCGGDFITFDLFDKACREINPEKTSIARSVMYFYMEKSDKFEALMYPDAIILDRDTDSNLKYVSKDYTDLAWSYGYDQGLGIEDATQSRIDTQIELENKLQELQTDIEENGFDSDKQSELEKIQEILARLNSDPIPTVSNVVIHRAESTSELSVTMYDMSMATIARIIGGSGALQGLVVSMTTTDAMDPAAQIAEIRRQIANIKKIASIANAFACLKSIKLLDLVLMLIEPVISEIANQLISFFGQLKSAIISPPLEWLNKLSEKTNLIPYKTEKTTVTRIKKKDGQPVPVTETKTKYIALSQAIDQVANMIIEVANNIEAKFDDFILDYYKSTLARSDAMKDNLRNCGKKLWAQRLCDVLDAMLICLDAVQDPTIFNSFEGVQSYVDRVKDKLDWEYDSESFTLPTADNALEGYMEPILEPVIENLDWRRNSIYNEEL